GVHWQPGGPVTVAPKAPAPASASSVCGLNVNRHPAAGWGTGKATTGAACIVAGRGWPGPLGRGLERPTPVPSPVVLDNTSQLASVVTAHGHCAPVLISTRLISPSAETDAPERPNDTAHSAEGTKFAVSECAASIVIVSGFVVTDASPDQRSNL